MAKKKKTYKRKKPMGLLGKVGVGIAAGFPIAWSGIDGASGFWHLFQSGEYGFWESAKMGMASFVDSITCGFTTIKVFGSVDLRKTDGTISAVATNASIPAGGYAYSTLVGTGMTIMDYVLGEYVFKKTSKKIAGIQLIRG